LLSSMKIVGVTGFGGLWVLKWAWHIRVTNLSCVQGYGDPNSLALIVSEILPFISTIF